MRENVLTIISKYPVAGDVKTRLGESIGMVQAAKLSKAMLLDLVDNHRGQSYDLIVEAGDAKYLPDFKRLLPQASVRVVLGDCIIGDRAILWDVFKHHLTRYRKVIAILSDTPKVGVSLVEQGFLTLDSYDVVIGSDSGGGYYLIGMSRPYDLFSPLKLIEGKRRPYYEDTLRLIRSYGLSYKLMEPRVDIDTVDDIRRVQWTEWDGNFPRTTRLLGELGLWISDGSDCTRSSRFSDPKHGRKKNGIEG